ncbi:unnamed protein product [Toxocara canis]|uniref:Glucuronosyltransferase n=1 Tax=Toxocara canis TaxID=6265 RepID=A0A183VEX6_TOXCA|nr:unnamed protein product [Toxocara canis]
MIYRYAGVPFGIVSSPYLLGGSIKYLMNDIRKPLSKEAANNICVDNRLKNREAKGYFASAQMNLREFLMEREFLTNNEEANALIRD